MCVVAQCHCGRAHTSHQDCAWQMRDGTHRFRVFTRVSIQERGRRSIPRDTHTHAETRGEDQETREQQKEHKRRETRDQCAVTTLIESRHQPTHGHGTCAQHSLRVNYEYDSDSPPGFAFCKSKQICLGLGNALLRLVRALLLVVRARRASPRIRALGLLTP